MTPSTFTTILLVRHGTTATTGTVLPGRAPGLHLAERGVAQAEAVALLGAAEALDRSPDRFEAYRLVAVVGATVALVDARLDANRKKAAA